ncbi:MAG: hypothetical protein ACRC0X_02025 [Brevinema sp.]
MFKKKIISLDINSYHPDWSDFLTPTHIKITLAFIQHLFCLYPPKAQAKNNKILAIQHITWIIEPVHYKLIQDLYQTILLLQDHQTLLQRIYLENCVLILINELGNLSKNHQSLFELLKKKQIPFLVLKKLSNYVLLFLFKEKIYEN